VVKMPGIIHYPVVSEKAMMMLENEGKLQFIVDVRATKEDVKKEVEKLYGFEVASVNIMITSKGKKKAIVSFVEADAAHEIASRIGIY